MPGKNDRFCAIESLIERAVKITIATTAVALFLSGTALADSPFFGATEPLTVIYIAPAIPTLTLIQVEDTGPRELITSATRADSSSRGGDRGLEAATAPAAKLESVSEGVANVLALNEKESFIQLAGEAARESERNTGVPASVTLAQAILESDWGKSTIGGANNFFGIKASSGPGPAGVVFASTKEFVNNAWVTVQAPFRAYNNMAESFTDHGRFFIENKRYSKALESRENPKAFAREIHKAGYATDPTYSDKLIKLMDNHNLYRFDLPR